MSDVAVHSRNGHNDCYTTYPQQQLLHLFYYRTSYLFVGVVCEFSRCCHTLDIFSTGEGCVNDRLWNMKGSEVLEWRTSGDEKLASSWPQ